VFVLGSLVWFALTDIKDIQEVITGIVIALLISLLAGHFLVVNQTSRGVLRRLLYLVIYIFRFLWELMKANLNVAYLVIHPKLPIKPGIVKIKTKLTKDSALTLLGNSITLTPGTMTVDINEDKKELYIHWIYVKEVQEEKATQEISQNFERNINGDFRMRVLRWIIGLIIFAAFFYLNFFIYDGELLFKLINVILFSSLLILLRVMLVQLL